MAHLYTADPHFGHSRIMEFCKRKFSSVSEMDGRILTNYQSAVGVDDDLWIIGDFAFAKSEEAGRLEGLLASIPGRKHLIRGNHDKPWMTKLSGWASVHDLLEIKDEGHRVTLCHYPMLTFPGARHGALHLFGHVHDNWLGTSNSINAGVDVWDFKPITLKDAVRRAKALPENPLFQKVEGKAGIPDE